MFAKGFKIVDKKRFEVYIENVECLDNEAIVKIETAAICKADLRYYLGLREKRILGLKYPINLLHEAVGVVLKDPSGKFNPGDKVTLCPNIVEENILKLYPKCSDKELGENYCPKAKFASSSIDGFSRNYMSFPIRNLIKIPDDIPNNISVFSELTSVIHAAIRRVDIEKEEKIAIWGDGILGYVLYSVLIEKGFKNIYIIGHNKEKLASFEDVKTYTTDEADVTKFDFDMAFECVGGKKSEDALNQIIDKSGVGCKIVLTGVAEENIEINTRKILEKGLSLYGVTRSNVEDFKNSVELFKNETFRKKIQKLVLSENRIDTIVDYYRVFEIEADNRELGKNIMNFNF